MTIWCVRRVNGEEHRLPGEEDASGSVDEMMVELGGSSASGCGLGMAAELGFSRGKEGDDMFE